MILNERIRLLREECGWTQVRVAKSIGIAERNYQRLETDGPVPGYKSLLALANVFDVSVDYLMGRTERREVNR